MAQNRPVQMADHPDDCSCVELFGTDLRALDGQAETLLAASAGLGVAAEQVVSDESHEYY